MSIFKNDRLIIFDTAITFLNEAESKTAKAALISEKIKTRPVTVLEQPLDYYRFGDTYAVYARNWTRDG